MKMEPKPGDRFLVHGPKGKHKLNDIMPLKIQLVVKGKPHLPQADTGLIARVIFVAAAPLVDDMQRVVM